MIKENLKTNTNYRVNLSVLTQNCQNPNPLKANLGTTEDSFLQTDSYQFSTTFVIDYFFELEQKIIINLSSTNNNSVNENKQCVLGSIVCAKDNSFVINFTNNCQLIIKTKKVQNDRSNVILTLNNPGFNYKAKAFFVISNNNDDVKWRKAYKSESKGPMESYDPIEIDASALCLGDYSKKIMIEFYSDDNNLKLLDKGYFTINEVIDPSGVTLEKQIKVQIKAEITRTLEFIDYLNKGLQINMIVGVDFTASNGQPSDPSSLHYLNINRMNDYELSIRSCASIVAYYDHDQSFPVYGFGGVPPGFVDVQHVFPLNFNYTGSHEVKSVDEMLNVYRNAVSKTSLFGPTCFAPIIWNSLNICKSNNPQYYYILLILTDGIINDQDDTITAIIEASKYPISIIIVGIGRADFSNMEILDGDEIPLSNKKGIVQRDIVQFVEFSKYKDNAQQLAEEVLKEIPKQVEDYFRGKK